MGNSLSRRQSRHAEHPRIREVMEHLNKLTRTYEEIAESEKLYRKLNQDKENRRNERRQRRARSGQAAGDGVPEGYERGPRGNHNRGHAPNYDPRIAAGANPYDQAPRPVQPPHGYALYNQSPQPQARWKGHGQFAMPRANEEPFADAQPANTPFPNGAPGYKAPYVEDYEEPQSPLGTAANARRQRRRDPRRQARGQPHPQAYYMSGARGSNSGRSGTSGRS